MRCFAVTLILLSLGCSPMYFGAPAPVAILRQQGELSGSASVGLQGAQAAGAYAISDQFGVRLSGGYRPYPGEGNGYGALGGTAYWAQGSPQQGPRSAVSFDLGYGGGRGSLTSLDIRRGFTTGSFEGTYLTGQLQGDLGYEWPLVALLGSARATYFHYFPNGSSSNSGAVVFAEPSICFQAGPRPFRFELRGGLNLPLSKDTNQVAGFWPFAMSVGFTGLFELGQARPSPQARPPPDPDPLTPPPLPGDELREQPLQL